MSYRVQFIRGTQELIANAEMWNDLWRRSDSTLPTVCAAPLADHIEQFHSASDLIAVVVFHGAQAVAALPVISSRKWHCSLGMASSNEWNHAHDFLLDPQADAALVAAELELAIQKLDLVALWLDLVPYQQPQWERLLSAFSANKLPALCQPQYEYGVIQVADNWPQFQQEVLSRNRRKSLQKSWRGLQQHGEIAYWSSRHDGAFDELDERIQEGFAIEDRSWKGSAGSSAIKTPGMLEFYCRLGKQLAAFNAFDLQFLLLNGKPIAFEFGFIGKQTYYSHKVGFDPAYQKFGPGQLLMQLQLERFHALRDCTEIDTMGIISSATANWCRRTAVRGRMLLGTRAWRSRAFFQAYRWGRRLKKSLGRVARTPDQIPVPGREVARSGSAYAMEDRSNENQCAISTTTVDRSTSSD